MNRILVSLPLLAAALLTREAIAQEPAHYSNARSYLKQAQLLMRVQQQPNVQLTLKPADDEVRAAINALAAPAGGAADTGGKDVAEHSEADTRHLSDVDRFRSIVELLHAARDEVKNQKPAASDGDAALSHIAAALEAVHHAATAAHLDREIGSF